LTTVALAKVVAKEGHPPLQ